MKPSGVAQSRLSSGRSFSSFAASFAQSLGVLSVITSLAQQVGHQGVRLGGEWIAHRYTVPGKPVLKILGKQYAAICFRSGGEDQCVPYLEAMPGSEIDRPQHEIGRRPNHRKRVEPKKRGCLRALARTTPFHQYIVELTDNLDGDISFLRRQKLCEPVRDSLFSGVTDAFRVKQN